MKEKKSFKLKVCYFLGILVIIVGVVVLIYFEGYGIIKLWVCEEFFNKEVMDIKFLIF